MEWAGVDLTVHLGQVLLNIGVAMLKSLLGKFSDLAFHHALLVSEKAVWSSKEAFQSNDFLEETKLGVGLGLSLLLLLVFDSLLDGGMDLVVDLRSRKSCKVWVHVTLLKSGLDQLSNFLNMSLSSGSGSLRSVILLDRKHQADWNKVLSQLKIGWSLWIHLEQFWNLYFNKLLTNRLTQCEL